jgi:hypothetical protein
MKFWIGVAVGVLGAFFLITLGAIGLGVTSSGTVSSPSIVELSPIDVPVDTGSYPTFGPTPATRRLAKDCVPATTPCGAAAVAAISDYVSRTHPGTDALPSFIYADYIEWPDSCLGVQQSGVVCAQVITSGYSVMLVSYSQAPLFIEYHTDLNGRAVLAAEYGSSLPPGFGF